MRTFYQDTHQDLRCQGVFILFIHVVGSITIKVVISATVVTARVTVLLSPVPFWMIILGGPPWVIVFPGKPMFILHFGWPFLPPGVCVVFTLSHPVWPTTHTPTTLTSTPAVSLLVSIHSSAGLILRTLVLWHAFLIFITVLLLNSALFFIMLHSYCGQLLIPTMIMLLIFMYFTIVMLRPPVSFIFMMLCLAVLLITTTVIKLFIISILF